MRRLILLVVLGAVGAPVASASAAPAPTCSGLTATADTWARYGPPLSGWVENLGFDGRGGMWASTFDGRLVRYDASTHTSTSLAITAPGASVLGPDGRMYVEFGNGLNAPESGILRFDPNAAEPTLEPFATGLAMANGLTVDRDGNFYVGDTSAGVVQRVRPDGSLDPAFRVAAPGADGVVVAGDSVYAAQLTDAASTVLRVPLAGPGAAAPLTRLGDDGVPRLIDDLDVGPDGALYVASTLGFLFRVDPVTGAACTLLAGLRPLTTARFPVGFPPYDAREGDLFLASEAGTVLRVRITGLDVPPPVASRPTPTMRVSVARRPALRVGRRGALRVTVRSADAACRAGVRLRLGNRPAVRTDRRGRATVRLTPRAAGLRTLRATKPGCAPARARVRVRAT